MVSEVERLRAIRTREEAQRFWWDYLAELKHGSHRVTYDRLFRIARQNVRYLLRQLRGSPDWSRLVLLLSKEIRDFWW